MISIHESFLACQAGVSTPRLRRIETITQQALGKAKRLNVFEKKLRDLEAIVTELANYNDAIITELMENKKAHER